MFLASAEWRMNGLGMDDLFRTWRAFDDFAIAAGFAAREHFPVAPYRVRDVIRREKDPRFREFKEKLRGEIERNDLRPTAFWRTFPPRAIAVDGRWLVAKRFDDTGRALFLGIAFRLLGGAAPFLLFWAAALAAVPVIAWAAIELAQTGRGVAAVVFAAALSASSFVVDAVFLGYSAIGFHVVALLMLVPVAWYCILGAATIRGLLVRSAIAGAGIALCAVCRGTVPFVLPGFALALAIGVSRATSGASARMNRRSRTGLWIATLFLVAVPYIGLRAWSQSLVDDTRESYGREPMPLYHDAALLLWKGLGDFDREKGYAFRDKAGEEAILAVDPEKRASRESEVLLRDLILDDVREDPLWLAEIIVKRFAATVSLWKLWPRAARDGMSIRPASSANEGVIDQYYGLTRQADWFGFGAVSIEAPVALVLAPMAILLIAACLPGWPRFTSIRSIARGSLPVLGCLSVAVLTTPVMITTATALEPECFVLVHFLALAILAQACASFVLARRRAGEPRATVEPGVETRIPVQPTA